MKRNKIIISTVVILVIIIGIFFIPIPRNMPDYEYCASKLATSNNPTIFSSVFSSSYADNAGVTAEIAYMLSCSAIETPENCTETDEANCFWYVP